MSVGEIRLREELYQKYTEIASSTATFSEFLSAAQELRPTKEEREQVVIADMQALAYEPDEVEQHYEDVDGPIADPMWSLPETEWPEEMQRRAARVRIIKAASQWDVETQLEIAQAKYGTDLFEDGGGLLWRLPAAEQQKEIERLTKRSENEPLRRTYNRLKAQNKHLYYAYANMKRFANDIAEKRDAGLLPDFNGISVAPEFVGTLTGWIAFAEWSLPKLKEFGYEPTINGAEPSLWRYRLYRQDKTLGYTAENMVWAPARRIFR